MDITPVLIFDDLDKNKFISFLITSQYLFLYQHLIELWFIQRPFLLKKVKNETFMSGLWWMSQLNLKNNIYRSALGVEW